MSIYIFCERARHIDRRGKICYPYIDSDFKIPEGV